MRVCCMMMQKNEEDLLQLWVAHHADLFGFENLYVYDNGSDSKKIKDVLCDAESRGVNIIREFATAKDFERKHEIFANLINHLMLQGIYDLFMPLDCDEMVGVRLENGIYFDRKTVDDELRKHTNSEKVLAIAGSFYNIPGSEKLFFFWAEKKVFFGRSGFVRVDHGLHNGVTRSGSEVESTLLVHAHFQHKPLETLKRHAREKLKLRVDTKDLDKLREFRGNGSHLVKYFFMTEPEYWAAFDHRGGVRLPAFEDQVRLLSLGFPFD